MSRLSRFLFEGDMKLDVKEVQERVQICEDERAQYKVMAADWEALWRMDVWDTTWKESMKQKGQEQVTLPTTFNTVNLAMRLFSNEPKIEVPSCHPTKDTDASANKRERWLKGMWSVVDYQQRRSIISDLTWQSFVRGRHCVEVKWVKEELPERIKDKRFPILIRTLDPLNVGVRHGPMWIEYAYHKYRQPLSLALQRYPNLKRFDSFKRNARYRTLEEEIEICDFWYQGAEGDIWNCVIAEDEFVKKPAKTDYPDIPIIEGYGDSAPLEGEAYKGLSILHPMKDLYRYQCRLASQLATGVMYYFWPMMTVTNDQGQETNDFQVRPGQIIPQPAGTKIETLSPSPNVPLAQAVLSQIDGALQQASFPGVMYGQAPGELQAGYGVSLLSDAAKGRVNAYRFNLERTIEQVNMMALGLVEAFGEGKEVQVWGKNTRGGEMYSVGLSEDDINGYYENRVTITPAIPQDIVQRQTLGLRQVEGGVISKRTYRDKYLDIQMPEDEAVRVEVERALEDENLRPKVMLDILRSYYPDDWQRMIAGTPLEQMAQAEEQQQQPEPEQPQPQGPQGMPPGMPPPGMGPGMMPPGMGPEMMGGGGPPMGPGPIQPPSMNMDAGTFPPELSGQMTPEMMGLPPGMPPEMWAQIMGQPLPPAEELNALGGL